MQNHAACAGRHDARLWFAMNLIISCQRRRDWRCGAGRSLIGNHEVIERMRPIPSVRDDSGGGCG
jgi:hypothetical protein